MPLNRSLVTSLVVEPDHGASSARCEQEISGSRPQRNRSATAHGEMAFDTDVRSLTWTGSAGAKYQASVFDD